MNARDLKRYLPLAAGLLLTAYCWAELLYRIHLYQRYGSQPFLNHVADDYFGKMYVAAASAAIMLVVGLVLSIKPRNVPGIMTHTLAAVLALTHMLALAYMNKHDMLVTYAEFARNLGP